MSIAIQASVANQVRALKEVDPALTAEEIVKLTGFDRTQVKQALAREPKKQRRPRGR